MPQFLIKHRANNACGRFLFLKTSVYISQIENFKEPYVWLSENLNF
jgi:hypothetical protein